MNPPSRRVLGNKDTNAHLHPRSPKKPAVSVPASSDSSPRPRKPLDMSMSPSSPVTGIKRKIREVDGAERVDQDLSEDSQRTQLLSETDSEDEREIASSTNQQTSYETASTSLPASQIAIETQFELQQDEMSQRTLDKLHDVPLPQNTSQLPPSQPRLFQEMSAGSIGLSNFFNFEGPPSTQNSDQVDGAEVSDKARPTAKDAEVLPQELTVDAAAARKKMLEEKAEQLRTRLQLAMFKVQTKQINQPFSRLKHSKTTNQPHSASPPILPTLRLTTPTLSSSTIKQPSSARTAIPQYDDPRATDSAEDHIAAMRAQAANQNKPAVRNLTSFPMPRLDPQLMNPNDSFATEMIDDSQHFPSSPPLTRQSSNASTDLVVVDETQPRQLSAGQLSSPPASEAGHGAGQDSSLAVMASIAIATQGEAASGLVKLMTGE